MKWPISKIDNKTLKLLFDKSNCVQDFLFSKTIPEPPTFEETSNANTSKDLS